MIMKSFFTSLLLFISTALLASDAASFYREGNTHYGNGNYQQAITSYTSALAQQDLPELHYNLGNAYYKTSKFGKAILHYEKAIRLKPDYEQAHDNLALANNRIVDKIDASARKNLRSFWFSFRQETGLAVFGALTLGSLLMAGLFFTLFLLSKGSTLKKLGFFSGSFFLLISIFLLYFTLSTQNDLATNKWAIVTQAQVDVLTEPKSQAQVAFIVHEGTKVHINASEGTWTEVQLENGAVGWVSEESITEI